MCFLLDRNAVVQNQGGVTAAVYGFPLEDYEG